MKLVHVPSHRHEYVSPTPPKMFAMVNTQISKGTSMCTPHETEHHFDEPAKIGAAAYHDFEKWFDLKETREEYMTMFHVIQNQRVAAPGPIRYLVQYSFQEGFKRASALVQGSRSPLLLPPLDQDLQRVILCSECGIYCQHERHEDPELDLDGFTCCGCGEFTEWSLGLHREYRA